MSERLQGHRTKLNANKMTCDGTCSSCWKQPVFNSFSRTVQTSGVAWTWAATLTPWRIRADCSTLAPQPRERHGRRQWTAVMEERRERVLMPSAGAATYRGRRHAGSRWRGTVAQCRGDSGRRGFVYLADFFSQRLYFLTRPTSTLRVTLSNL